MNQFKIDLCLTTKNSFTYLPLLIRSLERQTFKGSMRLLVSDNNSNDGTIEKLKTFKYTKFISFVDSSPEEGFNKLLIEDQSNLKILIGSDDYLSENYLEEFYKSAKKLTNRGIKNFILMPLFYKKFGAGFFNIDFPLPIFILNFIGISRGIGFGIYKEDGEITTFNKNIKYASDFEFLIRCLKSGYYFKYVPCKYYHSKNGRSSKNWFKALIEEREISLKYNKNYFLKKFIIFLFTIKYIYKKQSF
tara:strand:- start:432 stop:1172 length:741 start_codon:yes stop_codon:yes gene_type:complete